MNTIKSFSPKKKKRKKRIESNFLYKSFFFYFFKWFDVRSIWTPLIAENKKLCSKIIFKYMNNTVGLSFKVRFVFFSYLWVPWTVPMDSLKNAATLKCAIQTQLTRSARLGTIALTFCLKCAKIYLYRENFENMRKYRKK